MTELTGVYKDLTTGSTFGTSKDIIGASPVAATNLQNRALEEPTVDLIGRAASSLAPTSDVFGWAERSMFTPDKNYDVNADWANLTKDIPDEYHNAFNAVRSKEEGLFVRNELLKARDDQRVLGAAGTRGEVASVIGGNAALLYLPGGAGFSGVGERLAQAGVTGRVNSAITGGIEAAGVNAGLAGVQAETSPTGDWAQVPDAALNGLAFGATLGAVLPTHIATKAQEQLNTAREEFNTARTTGFAADSAERPVRKDVSAETSSEAPVVNDSVGASSTTGRVIDPNFQNKETADLLKEVRTANVKDGLTGDKWDMDSYFTSNPVSQIAKRVYKATIGTPWADDFGRLWNSDSVIGQRLATQLFESASGVGQMKNRTAAILQTQYHTEIMAPVAEAYMNKFAEHLQENKSKAPTPLAWNDLNARQAFDRAVINEMQTRYHDGVSHAASSKAVREMADAIDDASSRAAEILKGRQGELPVHGAEDLTPTSGWYRQVWSGQNMLKAIQRAEVEFNAKNGRKVVKDALSATYQAIHKWDKKIADIVAGATINGSIARSEGVNTNLFRTMSPDNFSYLRQVLENDGLDSKYVDGLLKRVTQDNADRGKIKPLKERNDVDLRTPLPGTDMTLMDLIDMDINKTWSQYARTSAGAAATARNGIQAHEIKSKWIPAIKDELASRGAKPLEDGFYDAIDSYFSGRAYSGGLNPWIRRALTTTNLAFLNSLGLTQLGELGVSIGAMHLDNFVHSAPKELKYIFNGKLSPIHEDLKYIDSSIIGDHNIFRPELMQNETRAGVQNSELTRQLDQLLSKGARVQGFVSGFYKINQWMQRMSGDMLIRRVSQIAKGDKADFTDLRAQSLGFTAENRNSIMKYFKDGTVEYKDGSVYDLHADKWDSKDFQEFAAIINRNSGQSVQKAFRGEDAWWMHKDTGAFLMHLKSFTFTALHKQLIRNARIADPEALAAYLFSLGTAAAAYTAKQYTNGNASKMDGEKLMKGMLNYSNFTAPIVQFSDPVFGVLGMNSMQVGNFGNAYNGNNSLLSTPPSFNAINRMAQIPGAVVRGATGNMTKNDVSALQATPIVGNLYGMGYLANMMRDDLDKEHRKQIADTKQVTKPTEPAPQAPKAPVAPKPIGEKAAIKEVVKMGGAQ